MKPGKRQAFGHGRGQSRPHTKDLLPFAKHSPGPVPGRTPVLDTDPCLRQSPARSQDARRAYQSWLTIAHQYFS